VIAAAFDRLAARAEAVVVEGAGGALVPLSARQDMLDIPARLDIPVLLVVGLRLGCLNHAFLTAIAIRSRGLRCVGWVANVLEPAMPRVDENIAALVAGLASPCLATLRYGSAEGFGAAALTRFGFESP
jgi:dethiobiotin synthetase